MSFRYEKVAKSKQEAKDQLAFAADLPDPLKQFVALAIDALAESENGYFVSVNGHLHDGKNHPTSTASIEVRPR